MHRCYLLIYSSNQCFDLVPGIDNFLNYLIKYSYRMSIDRNESNSTRLKWFKSICQVDSERTELMHVICTGRLVR